MTGVDTLLCPAAVTLAPLHGAYWVAAQPVILMASLGGECSQGPQFTDVGTEVSRLARAAELERGGAGVGGKPTRPPKHQASPSGEGSASAAGGSRPWHTAGTAQMRGRAHGRGGSQARCPGPTYLGEQAPGGGRAAGVTLDAVVDLGLAVLQVLRETREVGGRPRRPVSLRSAARPLLRTHLPSPPFVQCHSSGRPRHPLPPPQASRGACAQPGGLSRPPVRGQEEGPRPIPAVPACP